MVGNLLIDILKSGTLAFLFSKLAKSIGQKEISEIIAGSGWCVVGVDLVSILKPLISALGGSIERTSQTIQNITNFFEKLHSIFG